MNQISTGNITVRSTIPTAQDFGHFGLSVGLGAISALLWADGSAAQLQSVANETLGGSDSLLRNRGQACQRQAGGQPRRYHYSGIVDCDALVEKTALGD